jgi:hypothetical protein
MSLKGFKKIHTDNRELNKIQSNVEQLIEPFLNSEVVNGVLLKDIVLDSSKTNLISHKLGRKPQGWIVIGKNANSVIWDSQSSNTKADKILELLCSANVTINLWVF